MTDITELTSVQKNANIHRLSRLIAYASNDELRQMAVEVEHYTDQVIEALEKAQGMETYWKTQCRGITDHCEELQARIAELESHTVKPPVHPTVASEKLDDETLQELIEFRRTTFEYHSKEGNKVQTIIHGVTLAALRELQERRKADSEPVAYLVCNGRLYQDRPFLSLSAARISVNDRNDGAEIKALCVIETLTEAAE
ncbi:TPA: hypothetical protein OUF01_000754 [Klebsiella michiganensis]|nr:hypothetical protein [Klebsiella michiganensis]HCU0557038.1 hypothetical protein [Klebsiella michiganensis]HCU0675005.1 hypothetical protein [Klebsiella michiganensis]